MNRRALVASSAVLFFLCFLASVAMAASGSAQSSNVGAQCVDCHSKVTPNVVSDWKQSRHHEVGIECDTCHGSNHMTAADAAKAKIPTPETCGQCHDTQVAQFKKGKHSHGHAQVLGWIGSFILGIGFYSIPKLRGGMKPFPLWSAWLTGIMWMTGVLLRWMANVYLWQWRLLLPVSASLELFAFLLFFRAVSRHKPQDSGKDRLETWVLVVVVGTVGLFATVLLNFCACMWLAFRGGAPAFPQTFDQRFLVLEAWGFMVPVVWGFSARWLPIFLGARQPNSGRLGFAVGVHVAAIASGLAGFFRMTAVLLVISLLLAILALNIFAKPEKAAKVKGIHGSFPLFVRIAYLWLVIAGSLGIWAAIATNPFGIWGASRHALTVGFIATMVFCIGQRVLPAFSGMRILFSSRLMFAGLLLLLAGCTVRVSAEVLAYQEIVSAAWAWLPYSAILELTAVTAFAINLVLTFMREPALQRRILVQRSAQPRKS